ncbi:hypothetical protein [Pedobacter sp. KLB.chiD]|uniref:hypothetical protein n=1 Tax=Pedobacter sp. KLB.chiD TaxID=3387402 RepID=UPI0039998E32
MKNTSGLLSHIKVFPAYLVLLAADSAMAQQKRSFVLISSFNFKRVRSALPFLKQKMMTLPGVGRKGCMSLFRFALTGTIALKGDIIKELPPKRRNDLSFTAVRSRNEVKITRRSDQMGK